MPIEIIFNLDYLALMTDKYCNVSDTLAGQIGLEIKKRVVLPKDLSPMQSVKFKTGDLIAAYGLTANTITLINKIADQVIEQMAAG